MRISGIEPSSETLSLVTQRILKYLSAMPKLAKQVEAK